MINKRILAVGVIIIVIIFGLQQSKITDLSNEISNINRNLSSRISSLEYAKNEENGKNKYLDFDSIKVELIEDHPNYLKLELITQFNKIPKDSEIALIQKQSTETLVNQTMFDGYHQEYNTIIFNEDKTFVLSGNVGLGYRTELILDKNKNYEFELVVSSEQTTERIYLGLILPYEQARYKCSIFANAVSANRSSDNTIDCSVSFSYLNFTSLDFESVMRFYENGKLLYVSDDPNENEDLIESIWTEVYFRDELLESFELLNEDLEVLTYGLSDSEGKALVKKFTLGEIEFKNILENILIKMTVKEKDGSIEYYTFSNQR